ncbi:hypothetical protein [Flavobacterium sp.]|jgi:hypothetical protein|uniref:hypothetical protein n=1 Tax=Flavobacterium sp. TaxID=239 RepID=UPI0037BFB8ED
MGELERRANTNPQEKIETVSDIIFSRNISAADKIIGSIMGILMFAAIIGFIAGSLWLVNYVRWW